jgi:hypothetical protein
MTSMWAQPRAVPGLCYALLVLILLVEPPPDARKGLIPHSPDAAVRG